MTRKCSTEEGIRDGEDGEATERTADEILKDRSSIPRDLDNQVQIIATQNKNTHCEVQEDALKNLIFFGDLKCS